MQDQKKNKLNKDILNIIRTTMRNNIELTHIADNKANVLLSLNALMLTFLFPLVLPYFEVIKELHLHYPIAILTISCFTTIYISALVLKPGKFYANRARLSEGRTISPFFFGNFYKMDREEFQVYIDKEVAHPQLVQGHVVDDLHYIGKRLAEKMSLLRIAFNIFLIGLLSSLLLSGILIFTH